MKFIEILKDLQVNLETLENYLNSPLQKEKEYALDRVKLGTCFVVYEINGQKHFAPSRFIGYKDNTMGKHDKNDKKDGIETKPAISGVLKTADASCSLGNDAFMDQAYMDYCLKLGITPKVKGAFGVERKFWSSIVLMP
jgi:hypothetical protein